ncbi:radical SAM family heme chaperone HemW [Changchengzhania lutea]|uniref:radical SAM family heme chaperone HemW n=1 Tax=Changchengzhania lutea TaxID=2049305 RepID=UPI003741EB25
MGGAGIYIHIPFCKQACFYCDFHFSTSLKKKDVLIQSLVKELELRKDELQNDIIETIYFGGGTPSLLSKSELELIIHSVYKNYEVAPNPEITLEANPDDLTNDVILYLSKSPINRLSIGIQSFVEDDLKSMNRAHNAKEAKACLSMASQHFNNITIDLIYGIPDMTLEKWNTNIETALSYGVNHISSYALTVEPKTALDTFIKTGKYPPLDEVLALAHFNHLVKKMEAAGFVHYEISNFGKPNYFSKHNTSYWQGKPYLGIGPSAHSFYGNKRSWNVSNNSKYIHALQNNQLPNESEILSKKDQFNEYIMTGLRTIWGVSLEKIDTNFGASYSEHLLHEANKYIVKELLSLEDHKLIVTNKGEFLVDGMASELFMI